MKKETKTNIQSAIIIIVCLFLAAQLQDQFFK